MVKELVSILLLLFLCINVNAQSLENDAVDKQNIITSVDLFDRTFHSKGMLGVKSMLNDLYNQFDKKPNLRLLEKCAVIDFVAYAMNVGADMAMGIPKGTMGGDYFSSEMKTLNRIDNRLRRFSSSKEERNDIIQSWVSIATRYHLSKK